MKTIAKICLIITAFFSSGCASHICVKTEVYKGTDIKTPKTFRKQAIEMAQATHVTMQNLDKVIADPAAADFGQMVATFKLFLPNNVFGDPEQYKESYRKLIISDVLKPQQPLINYIVSDSQGLEGSVLAGASDNEVRDRLKHLQVDNQKLIEGIQLRLDRIRNLEKEFFLGFIHRNFGKGARQDDKVKETDKVLAQATGLPVNNDVERTSAIGYLEEQIKLADLRVAEIVNSIIISPVESVQSNIAQTLMITLGDPNISIIVGSDSEKWGKYVNDVSSTNYFGNSETAFRMEGLGENHIKSVIFDPSEVTKVGLNVFSTALRITAAAYGFPLPKEQGSQPNPTTSQQTLSKPIIDAEIKQISSSRFIRGQRIEKYFWRVADMANKFDGPAASAAPANDVIDLANLIECMADEIQNPQTVKCGGTNGN